MQPLLTKQVVHIIPPFKKGGARGDFDVLLDIALFLPDNTECIKIYLLHAPHPAFPLGLAIL